MKTLKTQADMTEAIALEFSRLLRVELRTDKMREIVKRKRKYDKHTCASHDFCDANMVMEQAFHNLKLNTMLRYKDGSPRFIKALNLWNGAWDMAKSKRFYLR